MAGIAGSGAAWTGVRGVLRIAGGGVSAEAGNEGLLREPRPKRSSSLATKLQRKRTASAVGRDAASIANLSDGVAMLSRVKTGVLDFTAEPGKAAKPELATALVTPACEISPERKAVSSSFRSMTPSLFLSMRSKTSEEGKGA